VNDANLKNRIERKPCPALMITGIRLTNLKNRIES